jgi:tetratricopeptide (TPR) repeat protein
MGSEKRIQQFEDDFGLFVEAGFIAVKQQDEPSAKKLFYAALELDPESPAPLVGLGYIALNKLEVKEAEKIFTDVLKKDPEHQLARTFLGIAYLLTAPNRKKGEGLIQEAMSASDDPSVQNLGEVSLKWAEKDLKKKRAPFFSEEE